MSIFKFCNSYTKKYRNEVYAYFISGVISSIIVAILPYSIGKFIDLLVISKNQENIVKYCILFAFLNMVKCILNYISKVLYVKIQINAAYDLNSSVIDHMKNLPVSFFYNKDPVYLNQRINNDANIVISFFIDFILNISINLMNLLLAIILVTSVDIKLLVIFLVLISIYMMIYFILKSKIYSATLKFREDQSNLFAKLNEQLNNVVFIKKHDLSNKFKKRLNLAYNCLYKSAVINQKLDARFSLYDELLAFIAQLLVFIIGGVGVIKGKTSIGILTITLSYFNMILNSIKYFFQLGKTYQNNLVSYERIQSLLNIKVQSNGNVELNNIKEIELKDVTFKYDKKLIIENFSKRFEKGKIYLLVGENGAGKSTITNLILGLHTNEYEGNIYYNNHNVHELNMKHNRKNNISITEQEPILIHDTILNNILLDIDSYNQEYLDFLIDILGFKSYLSTLELGINTIINPLNNNISGGEKQKIAIIRSLIKKSDFIVFDEPTSALDKHTIINLKQHLQDIKSEKLIIIITHDNSIYDISDEFIKLDKTLSVC